MKRKRICILIAVGLLTAAGFAVRLRNLGALSLWSDEGFTWLAAEGILDHGIPQLPSGLVYWKGLAYSYLSALFLFLLGTSEFSLRFPAALASTASIPLIYLFGRRLFGRRVGLAAAALLAFSLWEVEWARNARYYMFLQFLYLLSLYLFYTAFIEGRKGCRLPALLCFCLTALTHKLGLTLACAFVPLLLIRGWRASFRKSTLLWIGAVLLFFLLWMAFEVFFWKMGRAHTPSGQSVAAKVSILFSSFSLGFFTQYIWLYPRMRLVVKLGVLLLLPAGLLFRWIRTSFRKALEESRGPIFCTLCFVLPLLGMGFMYAAKQPRYVVFLHPLFLLLFCWTLARAVSASLSLILKVFPSLPRRTLSIGALLVYFFLVGGLQERAEPAWALAVTERSYGEKINIRFTTSTVREAHADHEGPGEFLKVYRKPGDIVVAMHMIFTEYYGGPVDYWFWTAGRGHWDAWHFREGKPYDNYLGIPILRTRRELRNLLRQHGDRRVWIVTSPSMDFPWHVPRNTRAWFLRQESRRLYRGSDSVSSVYLWAPEEQMPEIEKDPRLFEAEELRSNTGFIRKDPSASGGQYRFGRAGKRDWLLFGTAAELPPGAYEAVFRLRFGRPSWRERWKALYRRIGDRKLAVLSVATETGKRIIGSKDLRESDIPGRGWNEFSIPFELKETTPVELRVHTYGRREAGCDFVRLKGGETP